MSGKRLGRAYREGRLDRRMRVYLAPEVLVIDEVGYLQLDDRRNGEFSSGFDTGVKCRESSRRTI